MAGMPPSAGKSVVQRPRRPALGLTLYHARYFAMLLSRRGGLSGMDGGVAGGAGSAGGANVIGGGNGVGRHLPALFSAGIDLHPHQVDAAVFASRSPFREGVSREKLAPTEPVTTPAFTADIQEAISEARRNRPEIKAAEQRISEGEQRRRLARHSRLPRLDAIAGVRDNQPRRTGAVGGDSRDLTGTDWNVGVEFSLPLGQMGARAAMRQAEAELAQRRAELRRAQEQAVTEARMAAYVERDFM